MTTTSTAPKTPDDTAIGVPLLPLLRRPLPASLVGERRGRTRLDVAVALVLATLLVGIATALVLIADSNSGGHALHHTVTKLQDLDHTLKSGGD